LTTTNKTSGYIALCITSIGWGTTWITSKIAIGQMPAFQMTSIRQFLGGISFVLFFMLYKKLPLPTTKQFVWLTIMSMLMFVGANGLSTYSLKYIPTGFSSLIGALYPLCVVLIEYLFFKQKNITFLTILGLLLGLGGVGIVFYENAFHQHDDHFYLGLLLAISAMLTWSIGSMVIARNKLKMDPYYATGWQMLISAAVLFSIAKLTGPVLPLQQIPLKAWLAIAYLVIMGSIICFIAFIISMKKLPPALFSLYAYLNPLVAMAISALVLKEHITINIVWGAIVTLLGVFLVNYSIKKSNRLAKDLEA
jgi:drug/metabolite transporter (DMT)-like permease